MSERREPYRPTRRGVLVGLGSLVASGLACGPARGEEPVLSPDCRIPGPTVEAVTGPFPPTAFRPVLRGRANPGAVVAVRETDLDLTRIEGVSATPRGQVVLVRGTVITAGCKPVAGAEVQLWQADRDGHYNHRNEGRRVSAADVDPGFAYWGSGTTDSDGRFVVKTIVPGAYPADVGWWRPPHLHWSIAAPGLRRITTQSFFDGDSVDGIAKIRELNRDDHILNIRNGFEGSLAGAALDRARRRLRDEQVVAFAPGPGGIPAGDVVFRVDA